ncbi:hypothetical protein KP79_PYT14511 [Mizuhopecten yessoensis]|uniref:Uncharacterized protein n=1 Tax=Mizuhopecten yessoensis TaxID=6573 RepID=A0A210R2B3_MIZYE|nr:hypothetical protein KP79_PYT14511 [Mizuhopecten yessoensis]
MEVSTIKKALRTHRMESAKNKIDFADISTFDIVPTPPKGPKPETARLQRRHRVHAQKLNTYEAKYGSSQDSETHKTQHDAKNGSGDFRKTVDPAFPWYCPTPRTGETSFDREENAIRKQATCNAVEATFTDQSTNSSRKQAVNANPIRYPAPGPREQLAPSPFPVNKNILAPMVDPRKNAIPKSARPGPRPVKAVHMPVFHENTESSSMLTMMYGCRDVCVADSVIPVKNRRPIRNPSPGPREQLLPSIFPTKKRRPATLVKRGRVVAPMCG